MLQVDGKEPQWTSAVKSSAILQEALSVSDNVGDKVDVTLTRNGTTFKATMVRMSVERVQAIRDWMELQSQNTTHMLKREDHGGVKFSSELLNGMVHVLRQQNQYEKMMENRIDEVNAGYQPETLLLPSCDMLSLEAKNNALCRLLKPKIMTDCVCVAAQRILQGACRCMS